MNLLATMGPMKLIIPNALPPKAIAESLADALESRCPSLVAMINARHASTQVWSLQEMGCTPAEGLELLCAGYVAPLNEPLGAGLGPARAGQVPTGERVWIAEFCSTIIGQERTAVVALEHLDLTPSDSDALTEAARVLFIGSETQIWIEPLEAGRWRICGNLPAPSRVISPSALHGRDLSHWWPMDPAWRGWRKLLNEIQMIWHEHPVNTARAEEGKPPINGVWLYGGGVAGQALRAGPEKWLKSLTPSAMAGDWTQWLSAWKRIESEVIELGTSVATNTATDKATNKASTTEIVLTGEDRIVSLTNPPKAWWKSLFNRQDSNSWRNWWANQD